MDNIYKFTIGDYWDDGHGKYEIFRFKTNVTNRQISDAYMKSCKLVGIQFHTNGDDHGLEYDYMTDDRRDFYVLNDYEDGRISNGALEKMKVHGLEEYDPNSRQPNSTKEYPWEELFNIYSDEESPSKDDFFHLMMWFIGLSLPELEYQLLPEEPEALLHESVGYGLFW